MIKNLENIIILFFKLFFIELIISCTNVDKHKIDQLIVYQNNNIPLMTEQKELEYVSDDIYFIIPSELYVNKKFFVLLTENMKQQIDKKEYDNIYTLLTCKTLNATIGTAFDCTIGQHGNNLPNDRSGIHHIINNNETYEHRPDKIDLNNIYKYICEVTVPQDVVVTHSVEHHYNSNDPYDPGCDCSTSSVLTAPQIEILSTDYLMEPKTIDKFQFNYFDILHNAILFDEIEIIKHYNIIEELCKDNLDTMQNYLVNSLNHRRYEISRYILDIFLKYINKYNIPQNYRYDSGYKYFIKEYTNLILIKDKQLDIFEILLTNDFVHKPYRLIPQLIYKNCFDFLDKYMLLLMQPNDEYNRYSIVSYNALYQKDNYNNKDSELSEDEIIKGFEWISKKVKELDKQPQESQMFKVYEWISRKVKEPEKQSPESHMIKVRDTPKSCLMDALKKHHANVLKYLVDNQYILKNSEICNYNDNLSNDKYININFNDLDAWSWRWLIENKIINTMPDNYVHSIMDYIKMYSNTSEPFYIEQIDYYLELLKLLKDLQNEGHNINMSKYLKYAESTNNEPVLQWFKSDKNN